MASSYSRRWFVTRLGLLGCALPLAARGHQIQPSRVGRIGFLGGGAPTLVEAFEQEMRRLRYVEGENIVIEKRVLRPNSSDLAAQAAELAHMNLDLIVANEVGRPGTGFEADTNRAAIVGRSGNDEPLRVWTKRDLARAVIDRVIEVLGSR